ncbi:MAG: TIM barrel protein, partial [Armatimonadota bacterium]
MIIAMHGLSTMHCNVTTEIRMANECGFDAVELVDSKLLRYLDQGYEAKELVPIFEKYNMRCCMINAIKSIERSEPADRDELLNETERLCSAAKDIGCGQIQLVPLCEHVDKACDEAIRLTGR